MQQERNPTTVGQKMAQIRESQNKTIFCPMQENFTILNPGAALERPAFLISMMTSDVESWISSFCELFADKVESLCTASQAPKTRKYS